ncbi:GGDEF domain-containing protein [Devosia sp. I507]|nr:GGDEF domain-containing protein [Devosia sp. I507]
MFVQPLTESWPCAEQPMVPPGATPSAGGFLSRLRALTGMAGAGFATSGMHWIDMDGATPPTGIAAHLLAPTGRVSMNDDPIARFVLTVPVPGIDAARQQWLVLWDQAQRSHADAGFLLARVTELVGHAAMDRRRAAEQHRQYLIERASATARIGIWSCSLPDEQLSWSDGVYDLFELPRGSAVSRAQTLKMYMPHSRRRMQALRARAIKTLGDFNFDAEIVTSTGKHRWMRITATVDGVDGQARRIFGMKQDVTEEKLLAERTRRMAETDALTGLANRSLFQTRLDDLRDDSHARPIGALILIDLDRFKSINDTLGHAQGDACLIEAGRRLTACCTSEALVARIGGDEFAIILSQGAAPGPENLCASIVEAFREPFVLGGQSHQIGASIGMARNSGQDAEALYRDADSALYQAKSEGRGTWRYFTAA